MNNNANTKAATLRDVAAHAGVSLATASCALGHGRRGVSDEMRAKVQRAADELEYQLRPRGRQRVRSLTVGAVVPDIRNSFFVSVLGAMDESLRADGHRLIVAPSGEDPEVENDVVERLSSRIDALALAPTAAVGPATAALARRGVPVVLVDRDGAAPHLPSVAMDNFDSGRRATMVLVEAGYERIALVNGPQRVSTARDRTEGYLAALADAGRVPHPERIWTGEFTLQDGRTAVHRLLQARRRPDAIFSTSAILTSGVLFGLREHGLRWPDDVAVIGYGDAVFASLVEPAVTVVEQPTVAMGEAAVRILLSGGREQQSPTHVVLSSNLVLRDSHWRTPRVAARQRGAAGAVTGAPAPGVAASDVPPAPQVGVTAAAETLAPGPLAERAPAARAARERASQLRQAPARTSPPRTAVVAARGEQAW